MTMISPTHRRAVVQCALVLLPSLVLAAPVAVNDSYTMTEDTVLSVTGAATTNLVTADFEPGASQADGFTLVKNAFGTAANTASTAFMSGALVTTDKHAGTSSYYVDAGRDSVQNVPKSVGIQTSITLPSAATVRLTYWYRMKVTGMEWGGGGPPLQYELGDHLLKIDNTYYGTAYTETLPTPDVTNTAIRHVLGPQGNVSGSNAVNDSLWLQYTNDILLPAGVHTFTLGTYNNSTNNGSEHTEIWFDDVTIDSVNASGGVLLNDTGGAISVVKVANPLHGTVALDSQGSFSYTPNANYFGTDTFTYQASDGTALSNVATVTITVTGVNDIPVAVANTYNLNEDTPLTTTAATGILANDTDADGDTLTATALTQPTHGTSSLRPPLITMAQTASLTAQTMAL
jgi:VCBS repeat-containing protein